MFFTVLNFNEKRGSMMNEQNRLLNCANKLEGILRKYLDCHYTEFGVKANDNLLRYDWKSPINFALGCRYGSSGHDSKVKEDIDYFLGNELQGQSIEDVVKKYEYYGFETEEAALNYIDETIEHLQKILFS